MSPTPWPYLSYADQHWLGGESGADRDLAAVIKALRTSVADAGETVSCEPDSLLRGLSHLAAINERVDWAILSIVGESRAQDVSWATIGAALGVSKQAAQQRFAPYVNQALAQAQERPADRGANSV
jgi:hypothetical protein